MVRQNFCLPSPSPLAPSPVAVIEQQSHSARLMQAASFPLRLCASMYRAYR